MKTQPGEKMEEKIILQDSPEAATFKTGLSGWVSREGRFWGDNEDSARWEGSTHRKCETCETIVPRNRICCNECTEKRAQSAYENAPRIRGELTFRQRGYVFRGFNEITPYEPRPH